MIELRTGEFRKVLEKAEMTSLTEIEAKIQQYEATDQPVRAMIIELINMKNFNGLSHVYLMALQTLLRKYSIALVIDEVMTGFKTWTPFIFMQYPGFVPDYITFGKGFVLAGVLAVNKSMESIRLSRFKIGETTSVCDAVVVQKSCYILNEFKEKKLFQHILDLDMGLLEQFCVIEAQDNNECKTIGLGTMWKSTHDMKNVVGSYGRLLLIASFPIENVSKFVPLAIHEDGKEDAQLLARMKWSNKNGEPWNLL